MHLNKIKNYKYAVNIDFSEVSKQVSVSQNNVLLRLIVSILNCS